MKQKPSSQASIRQIAWNALTLNAQLYQATRSDRRTRRAALTIVIFAALSRAVASIIISLLNRVTLPALLFTVLFGIFSVVIGYYFWTFTIWKIGQWANLNPPTYRALLCPIGFAYSPQLLNFITILPLLGRPLELILSVWTLLAVILAVRKAMSINPLWAALLSIVSFPVVQIVPILIQVIAQQFTQ